MPFNCTPGCGVLSDHSRVHIWLLCTSTGRGCDLPAGTPVAFEAALGWGRLAELLEDHGFDPHLVHPLRCKAIASARRKNDKVDAAILAQLLRGPAA